MHFFTTTNLILLGLHGLSGLFMLAGILGTPGNPDENNKTIKRLLNAWGINVIIAWRGVPLLAVATLVALFFQYDLWAKIFTWLSVTMSFSLILMLILYFIWTEKKK